MAIPPRVCLLLALLASAIGPLALRAQESPRRRDVLTFQTFDKREGLQTGGLYALARDRSGLLWIATGDGATYYTGHAWFRVDMPTASGANQVLDLLFPPDSSAWFATRGGGVVHVTPAGDTTVWNAATGGLPDDIVYDLAWVRSFGTPTVLAATWSGIAYFTGTRFERVPLPDDFAPTGLVVAEVPGLDGGLELYVASPNAGMRVRRGTAWHAVGAREGLPVRNIEALVPSSDAQVRLYAVGQDGVHALQGERWVAIPGAPKDAFRLTEVVRLDGSLELWVGTGGGDLWRELPSGEWQRVQGGAIRDGEAISLLETVRRAAGEPLVYVGVRGERLTRVGLTSAELPVLPLPASNRAVRMVREVQVDGQTEVWVGTVAPGVIRVRDGRTRVEADSPALGLGAVRSVTALRDTVWAAGDSGMAFLAGGRWRRADAGLPAAERPRRLGLLGKGGGQLVLGTDSGVFEWRAGRWQRSTLTPARLVDDFAVVHDTVNGVPRVTDYITGSRGQVWEIRDGRVRPTLVGTAGLVREQVNDLLVEPRPDGTHRLWAATSGQGGIRILDLATPGATWRLIDAEVRSALPSEYVRDLLRGLDGRVYAATSRGLAQLRPEADGTVVLESLYGMEEGLPSADVVKLARLSSDELLVGTSQGVARLRPTVPRLAWQVPLRVVARDLVTDAPLEGEFRQAHDAGGVVFNFALLNYYREEDTRYRTELVGARGGLSEWVPRHEVTFPALTPGTYRLRVWARDYRGWVFGPVERAFTVAAPWWDTPVARFGLGVLVLAGFAGILAWRTQAVARRARESEARERTARANAERFRALFDRSLDAHLLLEGERVTAVNPAAARLFEAEGTSELLARPAHALLPAPPASTGTAGLEMEVRTLAGREVPVQAIWTPIPGEAGQTMLHVVLRDLSAARAAEAERLRLEAQLREGQRLESLGTLAGGIAHDFNNLLTVIRGSAEEAMEVAGPAVTPALRRVVDVSNRARDLVRQILAFSRRSPSGEAGTVDLAAVLHDLEPLMHSTLPRSVGLTLEVPPTPVVVRGDPTQMQQVVMNLVSNAEHAMRGRQGRLHVALRTDADDEALAWLEVHDTGQGMAPEVVRRAFEPFFTTKPVGEGTGLGLAVLHGIISAHGGSVELESVPGVGTTVTITLPRVGGGDAAPALPVPPVPPAARATGTTILVVDDDPDVLRVTTRLLRSLGHEPIPFGDPYAALAWLHDPDHAVGCLLTDQTMPGLTGDELVEAVRRVRPTLPALVLTGFSHVLTPERIAVLGLAAVLHKPVDRLELAAAIDHALAGGAAG